jgi:hypothetical protein
VSILRPDFRKAFLSRVIIFPGSSIISFIMVLMIIKIKNQ